MASDPEMVAFLRRGKARVAVADIGGHVITYKQVRARIVHVDGFPDGEFASHRALFGKGYSVTHVVTGFAVAHGNSETECAAAARAALSGQTRQSLVLRAARTARKRRSLFVFKDTCGGKVSACGHTARISSVRILCAATR